MLTKKQEEGKPLFPQLLLLPGFAFFLVVLGHLLKVEDIFKIGRAHV